MEAAVRGFCFADQPVHLLLDLVRPGDGLLRELLQETQQLPGTGEGSARGSSFCPPAPQPAAIAPSPPRTRLAPAPVLTPASEAKDQLWLPLRISSSDQGRSHTAAGSAASRAPFIICGRRAVSREAGGPRPPPPASPPLTLTAGRAGPGRAGPLPAVS